MPNGFLAEDLRAIADKLDEITNEATPKDPGQDEDASPADDDVTDMMTKEKQPEKLEGSISIKSLAKDLGIENVSVFTQAFNQLRQGKMPGNSSQVRELAIAFDKLLAADASTTSRVLTKLRQIHKSNGI